MALLPKDPRTLKRARKLRAEMSEEERILWMLLRDRRFAGFKFRRQVPLGDYVVDFVCFSRCLVLELDGSQHAKPEQAEFDARRTRYLGAAGFRVARIWCSDLFKDREGAMQTIWNALHGRMRLVFPPCGRRQAARNAAPDEGCWRRRCGTWRGGFACESGALTPHLPACGGLSSPARGGRAVAANAEVAQPR